MKMSKFEKLNVTSSALGFGCMRLPKKGEEIDYEAAEKLIDHAYKNGITYFDTAYNYHNGESEKFLGKAISKYPRDTYTIATKLPIWLINSREDMEKVFAEQLERLQTDYVDFYLIHAVDLERYRKSKELDVFSFLEEKKAEGKIRYIGFSFHDKAEVYEEIVSGFNWDFAQIQFNYVDYDILEGKELYEILEKHNIPCIVMEPNRGGYLSNLPDEIAAPFRECDSSKSNTYYAMKWIAQFPNIKVILSGMTEMEQLVDNLATFNGEEKMTEKELKAVETVKEEILSRKTIPCTGCRYCTPCFRGVDIPAIFRIYNNYIMFGNAWRSYSEYNVYFDENKKPHLCVTCNQCVEKCPQHINIPAMLQLADETLSGLKKQFENDPRTKTSL